jgi:streptogramin lyase
MVMRPRTDQAFVRSLFAFVAAGIFGLLIGCGSTSTSTPASSPVASGSYSGVAFGGKTMAGSQPLVGASVQLYAAGIMGDGSGATALVGGPLTTDANGAFSVAAGYACPSSASQLYAVARGGKPGGSAASANAAAVLMTAIGYCNQVVASSQIVVNEVTSVAAAYALSQFLAPGASVGATSTNAIGLQNAFATASVLANATSGLSPGAYLASNGSSPAAKIDSLANLLNSCTSSTAASSACISLFVATTPAGGLEPSNTLDAMLSLARHPNLNVATLYSASKASSVFSPVLVTAPSDWTLFINYTGGGMNGPTALGVDGDGNVWVASYFNVASVFSPIGVPFFAQGIAGGGLSASYGLAVDANNDAWIPNEPGAGALGNSVSVFNSTGQSIAGTSGFTGGGLDFPTSVAIDSDGSVWVVDYGDSHVSHLSSSGQALSGTSGYTTSNFEFPVAGAIDGNHNFWVANQSGNSVTKVSGDGSSLTNFVCCDDPSGLAIDQKGNVWAANYSANTVSEISGTGLVAGPYSGSSFNNPQNVAIDGAGNVWVTNFRGHSITELAGASSVTPGASLSPAAGWGADAEMIEDYPLAVDASGNLWVASFGSSVLTEFVGIASPVKTPLIALPTVP